ncbi:MAG: phenylacetic acid degradation operon negative regulatory protein [Parcubacteria group bacterium LiPW_39]|nr:MAG: phenylacetic acid degradation operon negative regulatory protein [Parcubacteria group bacterium LiPW_39]
MKDKFVYSIKGILKFLALGGVIAAAIMAPNAVSSFKFLFRDENFVSWKNFNRKRTKQYIGYLVKKKYIKRARKNGKIEYKITEKGKGRITKYELNEIRLSKNKNWDGKWRIVTFDIPEKYKQARDAVTQKLKKIGMFQLQKSVFVYPFECKKEIDFVSDYFGVYDHILYLEAKIFDIDTKLLNEFGLKRLK